MGKITWILLAEWMLYCSLITVNSEVHGLTTTDQCYGRKVLLACDPGHLVQIVRAYYRQTKYCPGRFHSKHCRQEEHNNPQCIGEEACSFTTPWVHLSRDCGYSNNFLVTYKCVPAATIQHVCPSRTIFTSSAGYISSPNYPSRYPSSLQCKTNVIAPPGYKIKVTQLDLYLSYHNFRDKKAYCLDRLRLADESSNTGYICSGQSRKLLFVTQANTLVLNFMTGPQLFKNSKGFWLYYEAIPKNAALFPTPVQLLLPAIREELREDDAINTTLRHRENVNVTQAQPEAELDFNPRNDSVSEEAYVELNGSRNVTHNNISKQNEGKIESAMGANGKTLELTQKSGVSQNVLPAEAGLEANSSTHIHGLSAIARESADFLSNLTDGTTTFQTPWMATDQPRPTTTTTTTTNPPLSNNTPAEAPNFNETLQQTTSFPDLISNETTREIASTGSTNNSSAQASNSSYPPLAVTTPNQVLSSSLSISLFTPSPKRKPKTPQKERTRKYKISNTQQNLHIASKQKPTDLSATQTQTTYRSGNQNSFRKKPTLFRPLTKQQLNFLKRILNRRTKRKRLDPEVIKFLLRMRAKNKRLFGKSGSSKQNALKLEVPVKKSRVRAKPSAKRPKTAEDKKINSFSENKDFLLSRHKSNRIHSKSNDYEIINEFSNIYPDRPTRPIPHPSRFLRQKQSPGSRTYQPDLPKSSGSLTSVNQVPLEKHRVFKTKLKAQPAKEQSPKNRNTNEPGRSIKHLFKEFPLHTSKQERHTGQSDSQIYQHNFEDSNIPNKKYIQAGQSKSVSEKQSGIYERNAQGIQPPGYNRFAAERSSLHLQQTKHASFDHTNNHNASLQGKALRRIQASEHVKAPPHVQVPKHGRAPTRVQAPPHVQSPPNTKTSTRVQTPPNVQTPPDRKVPPHIHAPTNVQAPAHTKASTRVQAPTHAKVPPYAQTPKHLKTAPQVQAPSNTKASTHVHTLPDLKVPPYVKAPSHNQAPSHIQTPPDPKLRPHDVAPTHIQAPRVDADDTYPPYQRLPNVVVSPQRDSYKHGSGKPLPSHREADDHSTHFVDKFAVYDSITMHPLSQEKPLLPVERNENFPNSNAAKQRTSQVETEEKPHERVHFTFITSPQEGSAKGDPSRTTAISPFTTSESTPNKEPEQTGLQLPTLAELENLYKSWIDQLSQIQKNPLDIEDDFILAGYPNESEFLKQGLVSYRPVLAQSSDVMSQERHESEETSGSFNILAVIIGSALIFTITTIGIGVAVFFRRKRKVARRKRVSFLRSRRKKKKNKRPYDDIILAYGNGEGSGSTSSLSAISNLSFSEDPYGLYGLPLHLRHPYGDIPGPFDAIAANKRHFLEQVELLRTIDERPEDIYSHFKTSQPKLFKLGAKKATTIPKSKSADSLADLYPSLEGTFDKGTRDKETHKRSSSMANFPFMSKSYTFELPAFNTAENDKRKEEHIELTGALYDTLEHIYSDVALASLKANVRHHTEKLLDTLSKHQRHGVPTEGQNYTALNQTRCGLEAHGLDKVSSAMKLQDPVQPETENQSQAKFQRAIQSQPKNDCNTTLQPDSHGPSEPHMNVHHDQEAEAKLPSNYQTIKPESYKIHPGQTENPESDHYQIPHVFDSNTQLQSSPRVQIKTESGSDDYTGSLESSTKSQQSVGDQQESTDDTLATDNMSDIIDMTAMERNGAVARITSCSDSTSGFSFPSSTTYDREVAECHYSSIDEFHSPESTESSGTTMYYNTAHACEPIYQQIPEELNRSWYANSTSLNNVYDQVYESYSGIDDNNADSGPTSVPSSTYSLLPSCQSSGPSGQESAYYNVQGCRPGGATHKSTTGEQSTVVRHANNSRHEDSESFCKTADSVHNTSHSVHDMALYFSNSQHSTTYSHYTPTRLALREKSRGRVRKVAKELSTKIDFSRYNNNYHRDKSKSKSRKTPKHKQSSLKDVPISDIHSYERNIRSLPLTAKSRSQSKSSLNAIKSIPLKITSSKSKLRKSSTSQPSSYSHKHKSSSSKSKNNSHEQSNPIKKPKLQELFSASSSSRYHQQQLISPQFPYSPILPIRSANDRSSPTLPTHSVNERSPTLPHNSTYYSPAQSPHFPVHCASKKGLSPLHSPPTIQEQGNNHPRFEAGPGGSSQPGFDTPSPKASRVENLKNSFPPSNVNLDDSFLGSIQSNSGSGRSKKSHATLYTDLEDIGEIFLPRSIAHSHGDVLL